MTSTLDLGYRNEGLGKALSNLCEYPFVLDGVQCRSIEGFLQSLKFQELDAQDMMLGMFGYKAWKTGQVGNDWRESQTLWWRGVPYQRTSREYHMLLERAYNACFEQNETFRKSLFDTGVDVLTHTTGNHDPTMTTLTEWEYIYNMYRLRARAQQLEASFG
jgi:predicted NAD-dependent protein-ADP-ribosyltransferase YbiA (DUF1768 family)